MKNDITANIQGSCLNDLVKNALGEGIYFDPKGLIVKLFGFIYKSPDSEELHLEAFGNYDTMAYFAELKRRFYDIEYMSNESGEMIEKHQENYHVDPKTIEFGGF